MRFGREILIHPYTTEKLLAETITYRFGEVKSNVQQVSELKHINGEQDALAECIQTIKTLQAKGADYAAIELFTEPKTGKLYRVNVSYAQETAVRSTS